MIFNGKVSRRSASGLCHFMAVFAIYAPHRADAVTTGAHTMNPIRYAALAIAWALCTLAVAAILSACGGGGGSSPPHQAVSDKMVYPVSIVVLRPCETTGPSAPVCPQAVVH